MTTPDSATLQSSFVYRKLPWLVGATAFLFYLATLSFWITPDSLQTISSLTSWNSEGAAFRPLAATLFFPSRALPVAWIPVCANILTAAVAAVVLLTLARCVALLRYDVFPEGDIRKSSQVGLLTIPAAWLPPVLAVVIVGLQRGFWSNATAATGELSALLSFAFALRGLLEFRITRDESWLTRSAVAFGAGMADNSAMTGYLPVFVAALIGLKTFRGFLNAKFLARMSAAGILGILLCLLLPTLHRMFTTGADETATVLLEHFRLQKNMLGLFRLPQMRLFALTGLIPFLILAVRWKSHTIQAADDTPQGVFFAKATGHFIHAIFFIVAIWIALEPDLVISGVRFEGGVLLHKFIWAASAGYCAGYFLLFKQGAVQRRPSRLATNAVRLLLLLVAGLLLFKNFSSLRITNGGALRSYVKSLANALPPGNCVLLTDEPHVAMFLRFELTSRERSREVILVETPRLVAARNHDSQRAMFDERWPSVTQINQLGQIAPDGLVGMIRVWCANERVFYAHPSSGLFFEEFSAENAGALHQLFPRDQTRVAGSIAETQAAWQNIWDKRLAGFAERFAAQRKADARWSDARLKWLKIEPKENTTISLVAAAASKALNAWSVKLLRAGQTTNAIAWLDRSIALNPKNLSALINREFVARCVRGETNRLTVQWVRQNLHDAFGAHDNWWEAISRNGPVDEPTFLLQSGRFYMATRNPRQAIECFERARELSPRWLMPQLAEAQARNMIRDHARALELVGDIQARDGNLRAPGRAQLLLCHATALRGLNRAEEARTLIERNVAANTAAPEMISAAATLYAEEKNFDREVDLLAKLEPLVRTDAAFFTRRGLAEFRAGRFKSAEQSLTSALNLAPSDVSSRALRAMARLSSGETEAARADYAELLKIAGGLQPALLGLGNLAFRERDTNAAIRFYEQFISNSPALSPQSSAVRERLNQLREDF
jgi:tetratricopeptide (TPR) repeat protein